MSGFERSAIWRTVILALVGFALMGCDQWLTRPITGPAPAPSVRQVMSLQPQELVLNLPSDEPCPCPYESTGSFRVAEGTLAGRPMAWSVADEALASLDARGVLTARATGSTVVTLRVEGLEPATASLLVLDRGRAAVIVR